MPSLMQIKSHRKAEEPLERLQVLEAGGGAGAVQQIRLLAQSWQLPLPQEMLPIPMGQLCCSLSSFWQVLPTFPFGALELALFPERNLKPRQVFKASSSVPTGLCFLGAQQHQPQSPPGQPTAPATHLGCCIRLLGLLCPSSCCQHSQNTTAVFRPQGWRGPGQSLPLPPHPMGHPRSSQYPTPLASAAGRALPAAYLPWPSVLPSPAACEDTSVSTVAGLRSLGAPAG